MKREEVLNLLEEEVLQEEQNVVSAKIPVHIGRTAGVPRRPRIIPTTETSSK